MHYRQLLVWQRAMALAEDVYRLTRLLPKDERFGLMSQMRRAARSVPANIAEGYGRGRTGEYRRFLSIAAGSLLELETDLELVVRTQLVPKHEAQPVREAAAEVGRLLAGLRRRLKGLSSRTKGPDA
jgi:four helix bundle protein